MKLRFYFLILIALIGLFFLQISFSHPLSYVPSYPEVAIHSFVNTFQIPDEAYPLLYLQTGLGYAAINKLVCQNETDLLYTLQSHLYETDKIIHSKKLCAITNEDYMTHTKGEIIRHPYFVDLQDGDILISLSTHTLGYRHGHAALVIDAANNLTLESITIGIPSKYQHLDKWLEFPTVIQLRLKDTEKIPEIVAFSKSHLMNLPYNLLTRQDASSIPSTTYCSHLVWTAFARYGIDLNANGGWFVLPMDLLNSDSLEIIQVLGIDPSLFIAHT